MSWAWYGSPRAIAFVAIATVACRAVGSSGIAAEAGAEGWQYVVPEPGQTHDFASPRAIRLSADKPEGLKDARMYRGNERRYAEIIFGTINSPQVAIIVDRVSPAEVDLYVDGDRSRSFDSTECHTIALSEKGSGGPLYLPLDAQSVANNVTVSHRRSIVVWPARQGRSLRYATAGYLANKIESGDRKLLARRVDADGDGFFDGPDDLVWLDLNDDGEWDNFSEQFAPTPILRASGKRFALRTEADGHCVLAPLNGFGKLDCALTALSSKTRVEELSVSLVGRDGLPVTCTGNGQPVDVPAGDYRVYMMTLVLADPEGGEAWFYHFRPPTWQTETRWHTVAVGGHAKIEPLMELKLEGLLENPPAERTKPNQELTVQTRLSTEDGLILVFCCRGRSWDNKKATQACVQLVGSSGEVAAETKVGFS